MNSIQCYCSLLCLQFAKCIYLKDMSFRSKFSKSAVEGAGKKWKSNLKATTKRRPSIPDVKQELNEVKCKMPSNRDIVGRFLGLFSELKLSLIHI